MSSKPASNADRDKFRLVEWQVPSGLLAVSIVRARPFLLLIGQLE